MHMNREVLTAALALGIASAVAAATDTGAPSQSREATTPSSAPPVLFHEDHGEYAVASAEDAGQSAIDVSSGTSVSAGADSSGPTPGTTPVLPAAEITFADQSVDWEDHSVDWEPAAPVGSSLDVTSAGLPPVGESPSAAALSLPEPVQAIEPNRGDAVQDESAVSGPVVPVAPGSTAEVLPPRAPAGKTSGAGVAHATSPLPRSGQGGQRPWYRNGLFALGAVLTLIFVVVAVIKRYVPAVRAMSGGALKVISRVHLSPKQSVALVQVGPRLILIGVTQDRLTPLGEISDPQEVFDLRSRAGVGVESIARSRFEEALESEAAQYEAARHEEEEALPEPEASDGPADGTHRVQETLGQLRTLVTRLRSLQQSAK